jgi:hypothetical protein
VSPDYETDSKKAIETVGANIMYTPTFDSWFHDGQLIPLFPKIEYPAFSWRPYVGVEVGDVLAKSTTVQGDDKKPAQFSWTRSPKSSAFTIDGALGYTMDIGLFLHLTSPELLC